MKYICTLNVYSMSGSGEFRQVFTVFSILTMSIYTRHSLRSGRETHSAATLHCTRVTSNPHVATCGWVVITQSNKSQFTVYNKPLLLPGAH